MDTASKRVAVIGAGSSGLLAIKALKEEGHHPVCFEKSTNIGGLWYYNSGESNKDHSSLMWSTSLNNSKECGAISDFPARPSFPNYMRHYDVMEMLLEYATKFDLLKHIVYQKEVVNVLKTDDYRITGQWKVIVKDFRQQKEEEMVFDAVFVCSGHLSESRRPEFPGMEIFEGKVTHTSELKRVSTYENKTVCVVGAGSSALDAAVEISHVARQVYLSMRSPACILTRQGPFGYPLDYTIFNYDHILLKRIFPFKLVSKFFQTIYVNSRYSKSLYNIESNHSAMSRDPAVNDTIFSRLMNGSIIAKKNIKYFTNRGVAFEDDDDVPEIDAIVLGTGYHWSFPFLSSDDLKIEGSKIHLYKCVFPPHLQHPTLALLGFLVPLGPGFPCVEMQCRWACRILSGKCKLPSRNVMLQAVDKQYRDNLNIYGKNERVYVHVDYVDYLDNLAADIKAKPNLIKTLFTDFRLFVGLMFQAFVPYRYRLNGPHKWEGARKAILTSGERMRYPLQGRKAVQKTSNISWKKYLLLFPVVLLWYMWKLNLFTHQTWKSIKLTAIISMYVFCNLVKTGKMY